ncbi:MAG: S1 RNA-binding domain-containing protein, partial [Rhodospirillales bacterium]|nr:S1 RNA-binding domain-containing protein [Rhodospirillales bacterium]
MSAGTESFAALLEESLGESTSFEGQVVRGTVVRIENDAAVIDVGLKSEGRIAIKEFAPPGQSPQLKVGEGVDVFVERYEDKDGLVSLSREKARREEAWSLLEKSFKDGERVTGTIFGRV